ncbi:Receptor-type tyrosine-protein phosphatase eta [Astathelohania contejeani]|uniref:Receptor-type tyrosine-protein phosphatase eta n=1 Tax=Astathelohania contejeani TaxID=164912 RepID=A0ABQ7I2Q3_9MICR|nr:Receptor-type tyrosine-protein phosphatase eta [Thelohania contejeani]
MNENEQENINDALKNEAISNILRLLKPNALGYMLQKRYHQILSDLDSRLKHFMDVPRHYDACKITVYTNAIQKMFNLKNYINASLIPGNNNNYIVCQSPIFRHMKRFVRLIKKSEVKLIISLNSVELFDFMDKYNRLEKENFYDEHGDLVLVEELFDIGESKLVRRLKIMTWDEHCPPIKSHMRLLYEKFKMVKYSSNNIIIHSKAGIGRACTFVMYDILSDYDEVSIEIFIDIFYYIRSRRPYAIKNRNQFEYLIDEFIDIHQANH